MRVRAREGQSEGSGSGSGSGSCAGEGEGEGEGEGQSLLQELRVRYLPIHLPYISLLSPLYLLLQELRVLDEAGGQPAVGDAR